MSPGLDNKQRALERRAWLLAGLLILCALLIGNWDLVTGRALPVWDAADFFGPAFSLAADHIKAGRFLLWDPWVGAGNPDFAEPELGTTSPILLLVGFLSPNPQAGFVCYWLVIWYLGGIGTLLLARSLGAPPWGAAMISLAFISSGLFTGHAEHTSSLYSSAFIPWILWRYNLALEKQRYWFAIQAGALYGLSGLGGYPQFTILTPLFLGLWTIGRLFFAASEADKSPRSSKRFVQAAILLLLTVSIGGLIFSPPYAGILESTRGFSDRIGPRPRSESIGSNVLPAGALTTFASPYIALLDFSSNPIWPKSDVSMISVYIAPVLVIFSIFAWLRRSSWRWWLALLSLLFLTCCLGDQLPVRGWIYDLVPPTRYFRNSALFSAYVFVLLAAAAAMGIRDFISAPALARHRVRFSGASLFVILGSVALFTAAICTTHRRFDGFAIPHVTFYSFAIALLAFTSVGILAAAFLFQFNRASVRLLGRLLLVIAVFDAVATLRISRPLMYSEATVPWWSYLTSHHVSPLNSGEAGLARQLTAPPPVGIYSNNRNVPLRIPTLQSYVVLGNRFQEQLAADPVMSAMALGRRRFWFSAEPAWLPPVNFSFESFRQKMHASGRPPLVLHTIAQMRSLALRNVTAETPSAANSIGDRSLCLPALISDVSYGPNLLAFSYRATASGWLLVTDRWAPGWRVTVNGVSRNIMGADFIFRGIPVQKGDNLIRFRYRPPFFVPLLVTSWTILLLIALLQLGRFPLTLW